MCRCVVRHSISKDQTGGDCLVPVFVSFYIAEVNVCGMHVNVDGAVWNAS